MKENKKIDNKMKAKKLAAYTLATCMTVTVAPIGAVTPIMAEETSIEMFATSATTTLAKSMKVSVETKITAGMTYEDAINKIVITDLTADQNAGNFVSKGIQISDENGVLYKKGMDASDNISKATDKFETGKKYKISATFDIDNFDIQPQTSVWVEGGNAVVTATDGSTDSLSMTNYVLDLTSNSTALKLDDYPDSSNPGKRALRNGKGEVQTSVTTVAQASDGSWWYVKNGYVEAPTKPVIASNQYGQWLIETTGQVSFTSTGLAKDADGNIVYVKNSKVDTTVTDVVTEAGAGLTTDITAGTYNIVNGKLAKGETVAYSKTDDKWYYIDANGEVKTHTGFAKNANGTWYFAGTNYVSFTEKGLKKDVTNAINTLSQNDYYVENSKVDFTKNATIFDPANGTKIVKNGVVDKFAKPEKQTVVYYADDKKWYAVDENGTSIANGARDNFAANEYGTWLLKDDGTNKIVAFDQTGFYKDTNGDISNDTNKVYYVEKGKVQFDQTYLKKVDATNAGSSGYSNGEIYYVEKGVVTGAKADNNVIYNKDDKTWYYVDGQGHVDTSFNKIAKNQYGIWKIDAGKVNFKYSGVVKDTDKVIGTDNSKEYYFEKSKYTPSKTGLVFDGTLTPAGIEAVDLVYVKNGVKSPLEATDSVVQYGKNWYSVNSTTGDVDQTCEFAKNKYGVWRISNVTHAVDFTAEGTDTPLNATEADILGVKTTDVVYFKNGKFQSDFTGLAKHSGAWTYFKNGVKNTTAASATDILLASDGNWYFVQNGVINSSATGIYENANGKWFVKNGMVDFSKTGIVTDSNGTDQYYVVNGKMSGDITGVVTVGKDKFYVKNNKVTPSTTGNTVLQDTKTKKWYYVDGNGKVGRPASYFGKNEYGVWYIGEDGAVDFTKSGVVTVPADDRDCGLSLNQMITVDKGKYTSQSLTGIFTGANGTTKYYYENGVIVTTAKTEYLAADGKYYDVTSGTGVATLTDGTKDKGAGNYKIYVSGTLITNKTNYEAADTKYYNINAAGNATLVTDIVSVSGTLTYINAGVKDNQAGPIVVKGSDNKFYYVTNGTVDTSYNSAGAEQIPASNGKWYYFEGGVSTREEADTFTP